MLEFLPYLAVMAGVTYLIRMLPLVLMKKKINNKFVLSFLHYIPYSTLSVMTFPACFYATGSLITAIAGTVVALALSLMNKGLLTVACGASLTAFICNCVILYIIPII